MVKRAWHAVVTWEYTWVCLLVLATLAMHLAIINQPAEIMFDEHHYVPDARAILQGDGSDRPEHPPLGKLLITAGIYLFGDNPVGWRIFPVISGCIIILLFYLICRRLSLSRRASGLAAFLLALENMSFVQASIAMLDVFCLLFMLAAFWLYLRRSYPLAAVGIGLAMLVKITGALAIPVILLHWLIARRDREPIFAAATLLVPLTFFAGLSLLGYFTSGHIANPFSRLLEILNLSGSLTFATATHASVSHPWEWLLKPMLMPFWYNPGYTSAISFNLWALIIPTVLYMTYRAIKSSDGGLFGSLWFGGTFILLLIAGLISDRISFLYYFYPSIGAICLGLGMGLSEMLKIREYRPKGILRWLLPSLAALFLVAHTAVFVILSPLANW